MDTNTREYQVLATLESDGWTVDYDQQAAYDPDTTAELAFTDNGPTLHFDGGFISGHLDVDADSDARAIIAEIEIELQRWQTTCVDPDHGIGDHPCDEVLGKDRAAELRDTGTQP